MIEPFVSEKLVFPRAWQVTSLAVALVLSLGFVAALVAQSA